jgi:hypothetical protein
MGKRRWILALVGAAVLVAAVAVPVALLTGGKSHSSKPAPQILRRRPAVALPDAELNGGYLAGIAGLPGSTRADASASGLPRVATESELETELRQAYALRAYPRNRITVARAQSARASFAALPLKLTTAIAPNATSALKLGSTWQELGPQRAKLDPYDFTNLPNRATVVSGRVSALAIGRRCVPGACRLYVGSAGGGVFRTENALAAAPAWRSVS